MNEQTLYEFCTDNLNDFLRTGDVTKLNLIKLYIDTYLENSNDGNLRILAERILSAQLKEAQRNSLDSYLHLPTLYRKEI